MPAVPQLRGDVLVWTAAAGLARRPATRPRGQLLARLRDQRVLLGDSSRRTILLCTAPRPLVSHTSRTARPNAGRFHQLHQAARRGTTTARHRLAPVGNATSIMSAKSRYSWAVVTCE